MREILFRGKRKDDGKWVFGSVVHQTDYYSDKCDRWFILEGNYTNDYDIDDPIEVQKETVGQYTGLTDKNGKRIFEGDVVDVVRSGNETWRCVVRDIRNIPAEMRGSHVKSMEVVGNIHDTPELLEEVPDNG